MIALVNRQYQYWLLFVNHLTIVLPILYTVNMTKNRVVITLTDEMHQAIKQQAALHGATQSGLIRAVMGQWLAERGVRVDWLVEWGGSRRQPTPAADNDDPAAG